MEQLQYPSAELIQREVFNRNVGNQLRKQASFTVAAGTPYAVVGTLVAGAVEPEAVPTLRDAIKALPAVSNAVALCWGEQPAVLDPIRVAILNVTVRSSESVVVAGPDWFAADTIRTDRQVIPDGTKWVVWGLTLPSPLTSGPQSNALEAAIGGVAGISQAVHMIDGVVDQRSSGGAAVVVTCHVRIEEA